MAKRTEGLMNQKILKYELASAYVQSVNMPDGAKILTFAEQHGRLVIWALVDPSLPPSASAERTQGRGRPAQGSRPLQSRNRP